MDDSSLKCLDEIHYILRDYDFKTVKNDDKERIYQYIVCTCNNATTCYSHIVKIDKVNLTVSQFEHEEGSTMQFNNLQDALKYFDDYYGEETEMGFGLYD